MPVSRNPIKASIIRQGFISSEAYFVARGISPARARELASRCVSNYRRIAGASSFAQSRATARTAAGAVLLRDAQDAFSPETLSNMLRGEGVL